MDAENVRGDEMSDDIVLTSDQLKHLTAGKTIEINGIKIIPEKNDHTALGKEIHEFYSTGWDDDYYYEDGDAVIALEDADGNWIAEDDLLYDLRDFGTLGWQGKHTPEEQDKKPWLTFKEAFFKWKAQREYEIIINQCARTLGLKRPLSHGESEGNAA